MQIVTKELIISKIYTVRNQKVMLDRDLAELYDVETKYLKRQVRRNINRFPEDFMFELSSKEFDNLRRQFGTSSWGGTRYPPMAFTEQGVAQLSSVINSERAIKVNIQIIRLFTHMRRLLFNHQELLLQLEKIVVKTEKHSKDIELLFKYLNKLLDVNQSNARQQNRKQIGFNNES